MKKTLKIKLLEKKLRFHTEMGNKGMQDAIKLRIKKLKQ